MSISSSAKLAKSRSFLANFFRPAGRTREAPPIQSPGARQAASRGLHRGRPRTNTETPTID